MYHASLFGKVVRGSHLLNKSKILDQGIWPGRDSPIDYGQPGPQRAGILQPAYARAKRMGEEQSPEETAPRGNPMVPLLLRLDKTAQAVENIGDVKQHPESRMGVVIDPLLQETHHFFSLSPVKAVEHPVGPNA